MIPEMQTPEPLPIPPIDQIPEPNPPIPPETQTGEEY